MVGAGRFGWGGIGRAAGGAPPMGWGGIGWPSRCHDRYMTVTQVLEGSRADRLSSSVVSLQGVGKRKKMDRFAREFLVAKGK